ncbi:MAG: nucleoside-diphosphate sugar epimerase/dehydratase [Patescibacteria group bacterium]
MQIISRRKFLFLMADVILISFSVFLAFVVRFEGNIPHYYFSNIWTLAAFALLFTVPIFYFLKLYSFSWSYVSAEELISMVKGTVLSFLFLTAFFFVLRDRTIFSGFPRSTLFISYFFIFVFCGGIRFAKRICLQIFSGRNKTEKERILIVGAGDAGEHILRNILNSSSSPYTPVGFIDNNPTKGGVLIHGLKVLGKINDIPNIAKKERVEGLIIAIPSAGASSIKAAVESGKEAGIKRIKIVPSIDEIISGNISIGMLREVGMENLLSIDLLGKPPILDRRSIENFIYGKRVLVTGAAGSIGSELCRQIAKFNPSMILMLDQEETGIFNISNEMHDEFPELDVKSLICDITDEKKIGKIFAEFSPQLIFHAAAYKHVPLMEEEPDAAVKNNVFGTKTIAEIAKRNKAEKFIFISTDKAVKPTSVMGATKRIGEMICQSLNNGTKFVSVRFGNVLDSRGSVINIFREQIKKGGPVEVTHKDMERYFMPTIDACLLVIQASAMGKGGEVFVLDMGKPFKILDLAKKMIRLSGFEPEKDVPIIFTGPRPGEKIVEEFLTAEEGTMATQNQKIFIAKLFNEDKEKLDSFLNKLKEAAESSDIFSIKKILKEIVPNYQINK